MDRLESFLQYCKDQGHSFTAADIASAFGIPPDVHQEDYPVFIRNLVDLSINSSNNEDEELEAVTGGGFLISLAVGILVTYAINGAFKLGQRRMAKKGQQQLDDQNSRYASELAAEQAIQNKRLEEAKARIFGI
jgi:hypothetical protein